MVGGSAANYIARPEPGDRLLFGGSIRKLKSQAAADAIKRARSLKAGSFTFFGEWFGKPYDNWHKILGCSAVGADLIVEFEGGETLTVTDPEGIDAGPDVFVIRKASAVRWEWFYYGQPHSAESRYFFQYTVHGSSVKADTNVDWYTPALSPSISENAIEMH